MRCGESGSEGIASGSDHSLWDRSMEFGAECSDLESEIGIEKTP